MRKKIAYVNLAGLTLLSAGVLTACQSGTAKKDAAANQSFVSEITHEGTAIKGGQLNYAIVHASQSTGILIDELTESSVDQSFAGMLDSAMFSYDGDRKLDDSGLAKAEFDLDAKKITVTLTGKDYKWSDGQAFTIDDYIFTIEQMASKDYTGVRFDDTQKNIVGMDEFIAGTAKTVSGINKIDDYTVELTMKEMNPSMMYAGGSVPAYVMPKHIYKDIPVKDWASSDYSRTAKTVGMGPFTVKETVNGESMTFVPNEHYYKGKIKIDSVKMDIVSPDTIVSEMKAGNYDIAEMPVDQLDSYKNLDNITLLGKINSVYSYISFNLGKYDEAAGKNVMNADAKMNNVNLRQAIGYALDNATVGKTLYNGLYHPANSLVISFFGDLNDKDLAGYTYQPEKAKKLLDEAGYKDVDGDGLRENPKGEKFTINFAAMKNNETQETVVQQYLTWWKEIGLDVQLTGGRTMEFNNFYDSVQANDAGIDMYMAAWGTGYDPDPTGLWGPAAKFNYSRFVSDENSDLLKKIASVESFDETKNLENFKKWQAYAAEQAFAIPTFEREVVTAINKRVNYYDTYYGSASNAKWENLELLADKGLAAK